MANEVNNRDQNHVTVLSAITNDSNQEIRMLRVDPATGRLIVSAVVAGTNNGQLKVSAADTTYGYLYNKLTAGSNVTLTILNPGANETVQIDVQGGGYDEVQENAVALPARNILNFENGFSVADNVGNVSTDVNINEAELDLALMGGLLDLSTQVSGQLDAAYIDESSLDLANIGGLLDLSTQVTGLLDVSNIDVTSLANDSTFIDALVANTYFTTELAQDSNFITELTNNATFIGDLITEINLAGDVEVVADGVTITGTGTTLDPLVAVGGGSPLEVEIDGVSLETGVTKINFKNGPTGTNPATGEVDIDFSSIVGGGGGTKLAIDTTQFTTNSQTYVDMYTVNIPGGTLGTNDAIRFSIITSDLDLDNTENLLVKIFYGGAEIVPEISIAGDGSSAPVTISGFIVANNATNAQKAQSRIDYGDGDTKQIVTGYGTGTIDSTVDQDLVVKVRFDASGNTITAESIIVEKIDGVGNGGNIINITAGEDLTAGDTVGFASNIPDTVTKALWAYRTNSYPSSAYSKDSNLAICEIDTDKYAVIIETTEPGTDMPMRAVIATYNPSTMSFSFGAISSLIERVPNGNQVAVKLDTDKFAVCYFEDSVPYEIAVTVCTVSGTTITVGNTDTLVGGGNAGCVDAVQLGGDRFAMLVTYHGAGSKFDLFEVTVSGNTPTVTAPTAVAAASNNTIGIIEKIATDKVAIYYGTNLYVCTVSGGSWTIGSPLGTTTSSGANFAYIGLVSIATDEFWLCMRSGNDRIIRNYTVSGTTITQVATGTFTDANSTASTLVTDNTNVYLWSFSSTDYLSGIAKLSKSGAVITIEPFAARFALNGSGTMSVGAVLMKSHAIRNSGTYYGVIPLEITSDSLNYHIQGMTNYFSGIAQSTVAKGATVNVKIGGVDSNQTGLIAGALYEPFEGGLVTSTTPNELTMQAQAPTKIKIA